MAYRATHAAIAEFQSHREEKGSTGEPVAGDDFAESAARLRAHLEPDPQKGSAALEDKMTVFVVVASHKLRDSTAPRRACGELDSAQVDVDREAGFVDSAGGDDAGASRQLSEGLARLAAAYGRVRRMETLPYSVQGGELQRGRCRSRGSGEGLRTSVGSFGPEPYRVMRSMCRVNRPCLCRPSGGD